jgi:cell division protein FtsZ
VNITGGDDLTLGDVHQIVEIVKDAVGEDAEIIFGTVNEKAMQGECRVTVIATGFDKNPAPAAGLSSSASPLHTMPRSTPVIQLPVQRTPVRPPVQPRGAVTPDIPRKVTPLPTPQSIEQKDANGQDLSDMEIPTFIRRQMD